MAVGGTTEIAILTVSAINAMIIVTPIRRMGHALG
ncbi:hypothetical protein ES703_97301 [subsurface metagenome]